MQNSAKSQEEILLKELLARKEGARSLEKFSEYLYEVPPARHHSILCRKIDELLTIPNGRLIVCAPPGSAKSTYCSMAAPAYFVGKASSKLGTQVIAASNTAELAEGFGRKIRDRVNSQRFKNMFPDCTLDGSNSSAGKWGTTNGATYFSVGVGGTVTGQRADFLILDDLLKGRQQAESPGQRQMVWEWFMDDAMTRLKPGGKAIMIATRWHEDDPIGRLLEMDRKRGTPQWQLVSFEAICEHPELDPLGRKFGEPLWPEWQPLEDLNRIKEDYALNKQLRSWYSLYQQKPTPVEGNMVGRSWFKRFSLAKKLKDKAFMDSLFIFQSWDTASTGDSKNDPSVCLTFGRTPQRDFYLLDAWVGYEEYPGLERKLYEKARCWNKDASGYFPRAVLLEDSNHGRSLYQSHRSKAPFDLIAIPAKRKGGSDKEFKFSAITSIFESGRFFIPDDEIWAEKYIEELITFPGGKHDDQVDATSNGLSWADNFTKRGMAKMRN